MIEETDEYPALTNLLIEIGKKAQKDYKFQLKNKSHIASGKLYNSISYKILKTENGVKLFFVAEKYYINIENGRKAGGKMPPTQLIKRWMQLKGITPRGNQTIDQAAYVISRSIGLKGIKANPYLNRIKIGLKDYRDDLLASINKDLGMAVDKMEMKLEGLKGNKYITIRKK